MSASSSEYERGRFYREEGKSSNYVYGSNSISGSEIEELECSSELFEINGEMDVIKEDEYEYEYEYEGSLFSIDVNKWRDCVYVGIGKSESSMDALLWTLNHFVSSSSSTVVYLLHVFPEIRFIPSPLGNLPRGQVSPKQVENYMIQERVKRRQLLQKFIDTCSSAKVMVETMLIESDMVAKAILDLIPILNIRKLVLGSTKSRKSRSRRGSGIAEQVIENAHEFCDVRIICEGTEVSNQMMGGSSLSPVSPRPKYDDFNNSDDSSKRIKEKNTTTVPFLACVFDHSSCSLM